MENTVYSFASLLAVYLFGTAAGAALYQRYELFPQDREASYQLFSDLMRANPMRREAYLMRRNLFDEQIR